MLARGVGLSRQGQAATDGAARTTTPPARGNENRYPGNGSNQSGDSPRFLRAVSSSIQFYTCLLHRQHLSPPGPTPQPIFLQKGALLFRTIPRTWIRSKYQHQRAHMRNRSEPLTHPLTKTPAHTTAALLSQAQPPVCLLHGPHLYKTQKKKRMPPENICSIFFIPAQLVPEN